MGGTSQDVKRQKNGIFTLYTLRFLDHLHNFCFYENYHVFYHQEASHIMSCYS